MKSLTGAVAIAAVSLLGIGSASAAITYEYTGLNFTTVNRKCAAGHGPRTISVAS